MYRKQIWRVVIREQGEKNLFFELGQVFGKVLKLCILLAHDDKKGVQRYQVQSERVQRFQVKQIRRDMEVLHV